MTRPFAITVLAGAGVRHVAWTQTPDPFFNINTPDDLARAEAYLAVLDREAS